MTPRASSRARPRARDDADDDDHDARVLARVTNERLSTRARATASQRMKVVTFRISNRSLSRARARSAEDARTTRERPGTCFSSRAIASAGRGRERERESRRGMIPENPRAMRPRRARAMERRTRTRGRR